MPTLPTFDALYAAGKAEVLSRAPDLVDWREGSVLDSVNGGGAMLADETIRVLVALFMTLFVDTAAGADLDALAADRFPGLDDRYAASASVATLRYTRGALTGVIAIPAGNTFRATVDGQSLLFTADTGAEMPAASNTVDFTATCSSTGVSGNIAAGEIDEIVDAIGGDTGAAVTNPDRAVGGDVAETDPEFRERIKRYFGTLRKGTVPALEAAGVSVAGAQFASVDEANITFEAGGYVSVYIGDPDGRGNAALAALAATEIEDVRAAGIEVRTIAAEREEFAIAMTLYCRTGSDTAALKVAARAAILDYMDRFPPNQTLYFSRLEAAAIAVSADVRGAEVTSPTGETKAPSAAYRALRVPSASLSLTATEV